MTSPVRVALVGFGGMGSIYAKLIFAGMVPNMRLSGVCCRNAAGQTALKNAFPGVAVYKSVDDTLAHSADFDAAIIVTPHTTHIPIATQFVQAGKPVLLDKPAGIRAGEVKELCDLCEEKSVSFAMMFNNRRLPAFYTLKAYLEEGKLGRLHRVVWVCNSWYRSPAYHRSAGWRSSWTQECGGLLINQNVHYLDMWQWLFGMPDKVDADMAFGRYNDFLVDDSVDIRFSYKNGFHGTMVSASGESPGVNRLEVWGSNGRLTVENGSVLTFDENKVSTEEFGLTNTEKFAAIDHTLHTIDLPAADYTLPYRQILGNFAEHLLSGAPLYAEGLEGLKTTQLTNACYVSGWLEKRVNLPVDDKIFTEELSRRQAMEEAL